MGETKSPESTSEASQPIVSIDLTEDAGGDDAVAARAEKSAAEPRAVSVSTSNENGATSDASDGEAEISSTEDELGSNESAVIHAKASDEATHVDRSMTQRTLAGEAMIEGLGLFSGNQVRCVICPADPNQGIIFERTDLDEPVRIPALVTYAAKRARQSSLSSGNVTIETVEHCLSALAGLGIDNAIVRLDGPELPCGDGSAAAYLDAMSAAGFVEQDAPRRFHRITEPITIQDGDCVIAAFPNETDELSVMYGLDYGSHEVLGRQLHTFSMQNGSYVDDIGPARTFSLLEEAQSLWDRGMCKHLTPEDVLVIGEDGPIDNTFRYEDEPVRHKVLDLLGDLYLVGRPVLGRIVAYRTGHRHNHELARRLLEQATAADRQQLLSRQPAMDNRAIQKLLHHRFPMLMVDRVVEIEGNRRAIGIKNVTINEPFFQGHYPGTPIMPGVLIVEAMAQLSGLLLSRVLEHTGRIPVLLSLDKVKLRRQVVPGDQLVLEAETVRAQARTANVKCRAFVGDQLAAEAQVKFIMVDADED